MGMMRYTSKKFFLFFLAFSFLNEIHSQNLSDTGFYKMFERNLQYPDVDADSCREGSVSLVFVVNKEKKIVVKQYLYYASTLMKDEVERILKMTERILGKKNIGTSYLLTVVFQIEDTKRKDYHCLCDSVNRRKLFKWENKDEVLSTTYSNVKVLKTVVVEGSSCWIQ
jgi:hypothetical protein